MKIKKILGKNKKQWKRILKEFLLEVKRFGQECYICCSSSLFCKTYNRNLVKIRALAQSFLDCTSFSFTVLVYDNSFLFTYRTKNHNLVRFLFLQHIINKFYEL